MKGQIMNGTKTTVEVKPGQPVAESTRVRDAEGTRRALLSAARSRFARDGYGAATVRDIAADAGVNVALISRYFSSKEGLFEACLQHAANELGSAEDRKVSLNELLGTIVAQVTDGPDSTRQAQLMLLLRSSSDDRADGIRRATLENFAERMALAASWPMDAAGRQHSLLRAQILLSAALGMTLLRSSAGIEPLTSATADELLAPLAEFVSSSSASSKNSAPAHPTTHHDENFEEKP